MRRCSMQKQGTAHICLHSYLGVGQWEASHHFLQGSNSLVHPLAEQLRVARLQLAPQLAAAGVVPHLVPHLEPLLQAQRPALGPPAALALPAAAAAAGGGGGAVAVECHCWQAAAASALLSPASPLTVGPPGSPPG